MLSAVPNRAIWGPFKDIWIPYADTERGITNRILQKNIFSTVLASCSGVINFFSSCTLMDCRIASNVFLFIYLLARLCSGPSISFLLCRLYIFLIFRIRESIYNDTRLSCFLLFHLRAEFKPSLVVGIHRHRVDIIFFYRTIFQFNTSTCGSDGLAAPARRRVQRNFENATPDRI